MVEDRSDQDPIEQLIDLFIYAPIGLLYEYDEVRERLVKRGKSQVQLARVVGQLAVRGRRAAGEPNDVAETAAAAIAKVVTEIGGLLGLTPDQRRESTAGSPPPSRPPSPHPALPQIPADGETTQPAAPIADYEQLKAKEIIPLLDALSAEQRAVVRAQELDGRARKTVLAKLDRLDD